MVEGGRRIRFGGSGRNRGQRRERIIIRSISSCGIKSAGVARVKCKYRATGISLGMGTYIGPRLVYFGWLLHS